MDHRKRLAKLKAERLGSGDAVVLHTLPGMTEKKALRLWFGPDRATWPPSDATFIMCVNGLSLYHPLQQVDDIPHEFMEQRDGLLFDIRWKRVCEAFDTYRQQVEDRTGRGLMVKTFPEGSIYSSLYVPTEIRFDAPVPLLTA